MRPTRRNRMLGIAVGDRRALVAEVSSAGGRTVVERAGEFVYPQGASVAEPEPLGRALGLFLAERGFTSRVAVIGIPGKWLLTKRVDAPPAEPQLVADTLRLQAEGEFGGDGGEFVYDYAGESSASVSRPVLLVATPKRQLDQVTALADAARLRPASVVPFAATLAAFATRGGAKDTRVLLFGPAGAEFVSQNGTHPRAIRYLGPTTSPAALLGSEVRRASAGTTIGTGELSLHAPTPSSRNGAPAGELLVWNDAGVDAAAVQAVGESAGAAVRLGDLRTLGATPAAAHAGDYATPVALALAGIEAPAKQGSAAASAGLAVDFLHSRLAPVPPVRVARRTVVLSVVGALVLVVALAAVLQIRGARAEVDGMREQVTKSAKRVKDAQQAVAKVEFAQAWQDTDPRLVQCLHDLTKALPEDGQTFLTSFNLNGEMKGGFGGKAKSDLDVLALLDRLNASGRFSDIKAWYDAPRGTVQAAPGPQGPQPPAGAPPQTPPPQMTPGAAPGPMPAPGQGAMPGQGGPPPGAMAVPAGAMPAGAPAAVATVAGQGGPVVVAQGPTPGPGPGGPPTGASGPRPSRSARGAASGGPAGQGGPPQGTAGAGEVTFSMTFNYVPAKKG